MRSLPALAIFLAFHAVLFGDVIWGGRSLSPATYVAGLTPSGPVGANEVPGPRHILDVEGAAWVDEPSPRLAGAAFAAGEFPLWNPGAGLGAPLAANLNSGAGNPLQLVLNFFPTPAVADVFYLGRVLLLGLFTWAFLSELMLAPLAALVGAGIVTYGGYTMAWIVHHPLSSEIFVPLMLLGFERGRRGHLGGWIVLAIAGAASLLGGKLQASLLCFVFFGVYALHRASKRQGGSGLSTLAVAVAGLVLGCALAGYLLVPATELMTHASGLTRGGRSQLAGFTIPWPSLASLAVPGLFVPPGESFARELLLTPAIGMAAVVLATIGLVASAAPQLGTARVCVLWALTLLLRNVGLYGDLMTRLPAVRGILFVKYTFTVIFALAVAAAIGLDALLTRRVPRSRAVGAMATALVTIGGLIAAAVGMPGLATFPRALGAPGLVATVLVVMAILWQWRAIGSGMLGGAFAMAVAVELWWCAPSWHPPRIDPYRSPAFVEFLQRAPAGRIIADPDLMVPLTSAAVGLRDLRAIDVLTPGSYYAFFTRLVSFCDRVIHFTVDPDVTLAATAPALDLTAVRYVATRRPFAFDDLAVRVRNQVGRERTARLLAGLSRLRTDGAPLAIGPVAMGDDVRFAFTLTTPFEFDVTADSEAAELAWGVLVRGSPGGVRLHETVEGVASDAPDEPLVIPAAERWQEHHVALEQAGGRRRVRLRIRGLSGDGQPVQVSLGHLGFGPGEGVERRLVAERATRHQREAAYLRPVFQDDALGVTIYENLNALPRAFRVARVEPTDSEESALTRLGDGFDFRAAALVSKDDVGIVTAALNNGGEGRAGQDTDIGGTSISRETPSSVTVATDGPTPALLVLADLAYPGWQATIDGRETRVFTVDGVMRGVVVPTGAHVIAFCYRPASLLLGALISALGLVALVPYGRWGASAHGHGDRV